MKKIKLFLIILLGSVSFMSCSNAFNTDLCQQAVQEAFPAAIVYKLPDYNYRFIVCDTSGAVYMVKTMSNNSTAITSKIIIKH